jgi:hypothetical protein
MFKIHYKYSRLGYLLLASIHFLKNIVILFLPQRWNMVLCIVLCNFM